MYSLMKAGLQSEGFSGPLTVYAVCANDVLTKGAVVIDGSVLKGINFHRIQGKEGVLDASDDWLKEKLAAWREEDINRPPKNVTFITGDGALSREDENEETEDEEDAGEAEKKKKTETSKSD
ncbi:predicted protein [Arabidopsis lyrata subsp. lyrata]|uniref:Predicted protein n=1 Tax=Arabidopsis lyrata subsp. lyrata TaxID=81972 RepID=D7M1W1_ARALL|nr:predicted protein [Arabidopsis lyrata subsp. lyrata]